MLLTASELDHARQTLPGWGVEGAALVREYTFASFAFAVAFVTCLGMDAEVRDHHPDLRISHKRVAVTWTSHDAGGITAKDVTGARESDRLARALGFKD